MPRQASVSTSEFLPAQRAAICTCIRLEKLQRLLADEDVGTDYFGEQHAAATSHLVDRPTTGLARINVAPISAARAIGEVGELISVVGVVAIHAVAESAIYLGVEAFEGRVQHSTDADA